MFAFPLTWEMVLLLSLSTAEGQQISNSSAFQDDEIYHLLCERQAEWVGGGFPSPDAQPCLLNVGCLV